MNPTDSPTLTAAEARARRDAFVQGCQFAALAASKRTLPNIMQWTPPDMPDREALRRWPDPAPELREVEDDGVGFYSDRWRGVWRYRDGILEHRVHDSNAWVSAQSFAGPLSQSMILALADLMQRPFLTSDGTPTAGPEPT